MAKVLTILANGFEEIEAVTVIDMLRRAGVEVTVAALQNKRVAGAHDITIEADCLLSEVQDHLNQYDMVVLPGGLPGATTLRDDPEVIKIIQYFQANDKFTAAICAAPIVLAHAGVLENKKATSYPGQLDKLNLNTTSITENPFETDGKVVTSRGVGTALGFALELVRLLIDEKTSLDLAKKTLVQQ